MLNLFACVAIRSTNGRRLAILRSLIGNQQVVSSSLIFGSIESIVPRVILPGLNERDLPTGKTLGPTVPFLASQLSSTPPSSHAALTFSTARRSG